MLTAPTRRAIARRRRRAAHEPGHPGRGRAHHPDQQDLLGRGARRRRGGARHPARPQPARHRHRRRHPRSGPGAARTRPPHSFSIGAGIWFALSGILASLAGGYAAGRLAGKPKESTAGWHGLTAWALTTLVIFYLLTSTVGGILGGAYRTVTSALGNVAQTVGSTAQTAAQVAAPNLSRRDGSVLLHRAVGAGRDRRQRPRGLARRGRRCRSRRPDRQPSSRPQDARERAAQAIARAQNIPVEQARTQVQQYEQQYRQAVDQAQQQATEAADTAARAVSRGALFGALGLILGAVAAWFGGRMGAVEPTLTARMGLSSAGRP